MQESSLAKIPQVDLKLELDDTPTREEIREATMQLKVAQSPGIDGIPVEVYQHRGEAVLDKLQDLSTNCWDRGTLRRTPGNQSLSFCMKTREKNLTVQTIDA